MFNNRLKSKLFLWLTIFSTAGCLTVVNPPSESLTKGNIATQAQKVKSSTTTTNTPLCQINPSLCETKPIDCWNNPKKGHVFILAMGSEMGETEKKRLKWANEDAQSFAEIMRELFGVHDDNQVCILPNVSKAQFEQALKRLSNKQMIDSDDLVIIYYSGHGTQAEDGGEIDESDGLDELFVTYSKAINNTNSKAIKTKYQLRDDDFSKLVGNIPTDNILIVIDACFSAGLTRGDASSERVKYLDNPDLRKGTPPFGAKLDPIKNPISGEEKEVALLSAAKENQNTVELNGWCEGKKYQGGRFTIFFKRALEEALQNRTQKPINLLEVFEKTKENVIQNSKRCSDPKKTGPQEPVKMGDDELFQRINRYIP